MSILSRRPIRSAMSPPRKLDVGAQFIAPDNLSSTTIASPPALRAVVLGASNVAMGFPELLARLRARAGGPVEVLGAFGHGRSYGDPSRFLGIRELPGIVPCGLWAELERRPPLPTLGFVTDIGNDLAYGVPVPRIAGWIEACLDRLAARRADLVLGLPPMANLEALPAWRYHLFRSILFPGRRDSLSALLERARDLNERLLELGRARGALLVEPRSSWYGLDPIHPRARHRGAAWSHALLPDRKGPLPRGDRLPWLGAAELRLLGVPLRRPQPVRRFEDGTTVALY
jgi:hypothetical protein